MLEPMLLILAWPVGVFAWILFDLHRHRESAPEPVQAPAPVAVAVATPAPEPAWQSSVSAAA